MYLNKTLSNLQTKHDLNSANKFFKYLYNHCNTQTQKGATCLPLYNLVLFLLDLETKSVVHWKSLIDDSDGERDTFLSLFSLLLVGLQGLVGKTSLPAVAIFYLQIYILC